MFTEANVSKKKRTKKSGYVCSLESIWICLDLTENWLDKCLRAPKQRMTPPPQHLPLSSFEPGEVKPTEVKLGWVWKGVKVSLAKVQDYFSGWSGEANHGLSKNSHPQTAHRAKTFSLKDTLHANIHGDLRSSPSSHRPCVWWLGPWQLDATRICHIFLLRRKPSPAESPIALSAPCGSRNLPRLQWRSNLLCWACSTLKNQFVSYNGKTSFSPHLHSLASCCFRPSTWPAEQAPILKNQRPGGPTPQLAPFLTFLSRRPLTEDFWHSASTGILEVSTGPRPVPVVFGYGGLVSALFKE